MPGVIDEGSVVAIVPGHLSGRLGEDAVVLEVGRGIYYGLNEVAALVWSLLTERRRVTELRDAVVAAYDVEPERAMRDLLRLLNELAGYGLIEVPGGTSA